MIPRAFVTHWRAQAPWPTDAQVEQDLALSRALVEMYRRPRIARSLAFRGGTALHKLCFERPGRYSEDIDVVQLETGPIGPLTAEIRSALDPWLGEPSWEPSHGRFTLQYRFRTTGLPAQRVRLKIEINTREHFAVLGREVRRFTVESPWFTGSAEVATYRTEELLGTKLRALYQRSKGRDLYDLARALATLELEDREILTCFERYVEHQGTRVSRARFEANLSAKLASRDFAADTAVLLAIGESFDLRSAAALVHRRLISRIPGGAWKGGGAEGPP